ncbi:unnamed protein product [Caenorhabditis bovis]|uniref:Uncharacterized protein n=1 Tax=Caenorhabditis bovis TaxID=2654633 RepID=A0A8S1EVD7_9PELO|nr:unnamed protein product [Caenorhabditis bovis]
MEVDSSSGEEEELIHKKAVKKKDLLSDDEDDNEDDEVVWERDVVVCNSVPNTEMYYVSYPSTKTNAWDRSRNPVARFKKNVRMLEMRFMPDTNTASYDKKKAELMGGESTSSSPQKPLDLSNLRKSDEIYEGRAFLNDNPLINSIGFMKNGVFYFHPVRGTFEMHRSINVLNKKRKNGPKDEENQSTEDEDEEGANTSNIRVKFSRPETERQKKRREASALHREKVIASDVWIPMEVNLKEDAKAQQKIEQLNVERNAETEVNAENSLEIRDLVNKAIICSIKEELVIESGKEHMLSKQRIDELPVQLQIKAHMIKTHVIRTSEMHMFIGDDKMTRVDLVTNLRQCARLVNGVWVLDSDLMFINLPPAQSNTPGKIDVYRSELWRNARDLALALIDAGQRVTRLTLITPMMQQIIVEEKRRWIERFEELKNVVNAKPGSPAKKSK